MTSPASTAATAPLAMPHRFGASYLLFDRVGAGGMAEIYLARGRTQVGASRLAVVKLVLPALSGDERFAQLLIAEAKLAAQLSHANIVQTYDLGREQGRLYIAMEYVEGFDLNELLRRCSQRKIPLPADFALFMVGETLRALEYAHRRKDASGVPLGIVHRDVSPSNVLISLEGEVKLCDFGIARAMSTRDDALHEAIEGKAGYMSPEHARGEPMDGRADVFAASIVLWELLAGRRLYRSGDGKDLLSLARQAQIPPLPDRGLPRHDQIAALVARGLDPDPAARFPSALAMARELDAYVMASGLMTTPLRLGTFLTEHFGDEIVSVRRNRERAATAIDQGPLVDIQVLSAPDTVPAIAAPPPDVEPGRADPDPDDEVDTVFIPKNVASAIRAQQTPVEAVAPPPVTPPAAPLDAVAPPSVTPPTAPVAAPEPSSRRFVAALAFAAFGVAALAVTLGWLAASR